MAGTSANHDPALAAAISLTPIDYPNQYLGGRAVTGKGAESIISHFVGGIPREFHLPDGDVLFSVEELLIDDGQSDPGLSSRFFRNRAAVS